MDSDGDADLVVGEYDDRVRLYENIGSTASPVFAASAFVLDDIWPLPYDDDIIFVHPIPP